MDPITEVIGHGQSTYGMYVFRNLWNNKNMSMREVKLSNASLSNFAYVLVIEKKPWWYFKPSALSKLDLKVIVIG